MTPTFASPHKQRLWEAWETLYVPDRQAARGALEHLYAPDTAHHASHPLNTMVGREALERDYLAPFTAAFEGLTKQAYILMEGEFNGGLWLAATGDFEGRFVADWLGIPANGQDVHLRFGEFCRFEAERVVESYLILDLISLMEQAGFAPLPPAKGRRERIPAPQAADGLLSEGGRLEEADKSKDLVERMIFEGLMRYDGQNLPSMNMATYWQPDMRWYGPAGIGSGYSLREFEDYHQRPFLHAFPDRRGGNHKARVAEGAYVASTGWPSIRATHTGDYLGQRASGQAITMRVMDWWRCEGTLLAENWVFIDLLDLFLQFGVDLLVDLQKTAAKGTTYV